MRVFVSPDNHRRLDVARDFLKQFPPGQPVLLVAPTRRTADELIHRVAHATGGLFGVTPSSLQQLIDKLAAPGLAAKRRPAATLSGLEAVTARVVHGSPLGKFEPLRDSRRFPRALARTLTELRLAQVCPSRLDPVMATLLRNYTEELQEANLADPLEVLQTALFHPWPGQPVLFLDLILGQPLQAQFIQKLAHGQQALATIPEGDAITLKLLNHSTDADTFQAQTSIEHLKHHLFQAGSHSPSEQDRVSFFSAPGEGRECVEIARRILEEARKGIPLDEIAVALRSPHYSSLLETAFNRAGLPAYFLKGTRRPDPSGRAFLVLLHCAQEGLSARRFAEYLSLGQAPLTDLHGAPPHPNGAWAAPDLEEKELAPESSEDSAEGFIPAPRWWERLLVEASVLKGAERWRTRLAGLEAEYGMRAAEPDPESVRKESYERTAQQLSSLRQFALPLIEELEMLPDQPAPWTEWVEKLCRLAERALRTPQPVLSQLLQLSSLGDNLSADLTTVIKVLEGQLLNLRLDPPHRRFGRVFVGTPECLRGRSFQVVFLPGLAEGVFPVKLVEDPLLPDQERKKLSPHLQTRETRAAEERLRLRLVLGAVRERIHLSYPRLDAVQGKPKVPSFFALEVLRAARGRFPLLKELETEGIKASGSRLDWPAPPLPEQAIDAFEHDLAVLRLLLSDDPARAKGKARYLLVNNPHLQRSLSRRWLRWSERWTPYDGLIKPGPEALADLQEKTLGKRAYSPTALQRFARCPYHFYLACIQGLSPREELESNEEITPQVKGLIVHETQARFMLEGFPRNPQGLNQALDEVAREYEETLAPPILRVWQDEIERLRTDLQIWFQQLSEDDEPWEPLAFEWSFGLAPSSPRDPKSIESPVAIDGRFLIRGSVDWVDKHSHNGQLRVTDHKTGNPLKGFLVSVQGGQVLQPLLYGLAAEHGLGAPAASGRLFYCTTRGGFKTRVVKLGKRERSDLLKVLETIDQAIQDGYFPVAPRKRGCARCDYRAVCGPLEEERTRRKCEDPRLLPLEEVRGLE